MDLRLDRPRGEDRPDLVERHALPRQDMARKNGVRLLGEEIVLGECAVGRVFGISGVGGKIPGYG